eukprot:TRINITY_DN10486_c0_g1_i2.p1 TRINITY_DN10486_c0_g1~~TRINITY_DN10486_c0_g1_i2.p1  ORF type:complete len:203 (-),score=29.20 TRINITY_DN10486_c0_g1_i2:182-790(-)
MCIRDSPNKVSCTDQILEPLQTHSESPLECYHIAKGFKNSVGCGINVFFWNGTHEELAFQLGTTPVPPDAEWDWDRISPSSIAYEATYLTHRFYVRLSDGTLVEERRVAKVPIVDCSVPVTEAQPLSEQRLTRRHLSTLSPQLTFKVAPQSKISMQAGCLAAIQVCDSGKGVLRYSPPMQALGVSALLKEYSRRLPSSRDGL